MNSECTAACDCHVTERLTSQAERDAFEADGFRIEAAVQFGFEQTADDCPRYACTESQLVAFAKACERKGMASVVAKLEAADSAVSLEWLANEIHLDIAAIDAELAPILETERQRVLCGGCKPAPVESPLCAGGQSLTSEPCEKCGATMDDGCKFAPVIGKPSAYQLTVLRTAPDEFERFKPRRGIYYLVANPTIEALVRKGLIEIDTVPPRWRRTSAGRVACFVLGSESAPC